MTNPILPNGTGGKRQPDTSRRLSPLGARLYAALQAQGMSQSALERALFQGDPHQGKGRMSRYMSGARGGNTIDVFLFERIADILHVNFHWLVTGRGLMTAPDEQQKAP